MFKSLVKRSFHALGLELKRRPPPTPLPVVHHGIDLVFDVGANAGEYALLTRQDGYKGRIVSFEPLPEAHRQLEEAAQADSLWTIHPRCALGAAPGTTRINIARNSVSSSIMPMLEAHASAEPNSVYVGSAETSVVTLDSLFDQYCRAGDKVFLKIDTQGYEAEVLRGCTQALPRIHGVQLELSTVPLYQGQELYRYFFDLFESQGFALWSIEPEFANRQTGQQLQFNAVFVRSAGAG